MPHEQLSVKRCKNCGERYLELTGDVVGRDVFQEHFCVKCRAEQAGEKQGRLSFLDRPLFKRKGV